MFSLSLLYFIVPIHGSSPTDREPSALPRIRRCFAASVPGFSSLKQSYHIIPASGLLPVMMILQVPDAGMASHEKS
jgi:hypothetical protein